MSKKKNNTSELANHGSRPIRLHKSVSFDALDDAIVLNKAQDGFELAANKGDYLAVRRPRDGSMLVSVCLVLSIEPGPDGSIACWDETLQQSFGFTPNDVAISDTVVVRNVPSNKVTKF